MELSTRTLETLSELVIPGVFALINNSDRKVDVRHSTNCLDSIARHLTQIAKKTHPCKSLIEDQKKITVAILDVIEDPQLRLLCHTYWSNRYKDESYSFYRFRPALTLRARISVEDYQARVKLQNANHDAFVVGCFDSLTEAESFLSFYYSNKAAYPVYACNKLTREYYKKLRR
jgi:hypothetical protein